MLLVQLIGQYIRRNPSISTKSIAVKLDIGVDVSHSTQHQGIWVTLDTEMLFLFQHQWLRQLINKDVLNGHKNIKMTIEKTSFQYNKALV